jgi:predicted transcriptional regulator
MTKKIIHNLQTGEIQEVDLTAEEETKNTADVAKAEEEKTAFLNDIKAKENLKASAKAKLVAGEPLTEDEANTIVL